MAQEGWYPLLCVGLRSQWEDVHLQDLQDSYGQEWVCMVNCTQIHIVHPLFTVWTQFVIIYHDLCLLLAGLKLQPAHVPRACLYF